MENIVECKNLTHYYGNKMVYENLSFNIKKGRILGLLGKNGVGKTTTINIINGFLTPRGGTCLIMGENSKRLSPAVKAKIGFLIEGHIQYAFMNVHQIEKFYSGFYPGWNRDVYFDLISKLKITPKQKISTMSCGQRSQVALGLILAQNPDLLVLDDFTLGLDPGYRRLFIDFLREYSKEQGMTVFTTSHIIQDMERLIDDCMIMDYNKVLVYEPVKEFMDRYRQYTFKTEVSHLDIKENETVIGHERIGNTVELYSYSNPETVQGYLRFLNIPFSDFQEENATLEDAFIGLTGKY